MRSHRILALLVLLCAASLLPAQDTAAITGTVRDNSGAVVPNADVKVTNPAGGFDRATTTNSDGDYLAAGLPAATYNLSVSAKGFQTYQVKDVVLRVAQKLRVDAHLFCLAAFTVDDAQVPEQCRLQRSRLVTNRHFVRSRGDGHRRKAGGHAHDRRTDPVDRCHQVGKPGDLEKCVTGPLDGEGRLVHLAELSLRDHPPARREHRGLRSRKGLPAAEWWDALHRGVERRDDPESRQIALQPGRARLGEAGARAGVSRPHVDQAEVPLG